jgi:hypothetical protein
MFNRKKVSILVLFTTVIFSFISVPISTRAALTNYGLNRLLDDKTYDSILSPQDYQSGSDGGNINLKKGQSIAQGIPLSATGKLQDFSPATALAAAGQKLDFNNVRLGELKFLKQTSLKSVLAANPALDGIVANSIGWNGQGEKTLAQIATTDLGEAPLPEAVLNANSIGQFGDIASTPYSKYPTALNQPVANFLGAGSVPLSKLTAIATAPSSGKIIAQIRVDRINTQEMAAGIDRRISSGSNREPHAPCVQAANNCSVLEIDGRAKGVTGSLWMVGQRLQGGTGMLGEMATAAGIREYAGYEVPGTDFKVVALSSDARKGTAQLGLDLRTSSMFGSTPFFIPVLRWTVGERNGKVPLPVEVAPVASTKAHSSGTTTKTSLVKPSTSARIKASSNLEDRIPTADIRDDPNIRNGNIGRAVKTNAINPAVGGAI